jgi:hypothetical protein
MFLTAAAGSAAGAAADTPPSPPPPIQDNSFLLEEAYNQETRVVQHISTFQRDLREGGWSYSFTQEWPLHSQRHQLSYTVPVEGGDGSIGIGTVALNYRLQLVGSGETRVACAPRVTLLLPTGDETAGRGLGATGAQFDLPVSLAVERWAFHANAGGTRVPSARNAEGDRADLTAWNLGASAVLLARPRVNPLVEVLWTRSDTVAGPRRTRREDSLLVSPGVRWAYDFKSGLQIVPGIAVPLGVGPSRGERSLLLYLSFEHPFGRAGSR